MTGRSTPAERACPACGRTVTPIPLIYGMPTPDTFREAEAGRVELGGCVVTGDEPHWACPECREPLFDDESHRQRYQQAVDADDWP